MRWFSDLLTKEKLVIVVSVIISSDISSLRIFYYAYSNTIFLENAVLLSVQLQDYFKLNKVAKVVTTL